MITIYKLYQGDDSSEGEFFDLDAISSCSESEDLPLTQARRKIKATHATSDARARMIPLKEPAESLHYLPQNDVILPGLDSSPPSRAFSAMSICSDEDIVISSPPRTLGTDH